MRDMFVPSGDLRKIAGCEKRLSKSGAWPSDDRRVSAPGEALSSLCLQSLNGSGYRSAYSDRLSLTFCVVVRCGFCRPIVIRSATEAIENERSGLYLDLDVIIFLTSSRPY
jgi:hypothetical protein